MTIICSAAPRITEHMSKNPTPERFAATRTLIAFALISSAVVSIPVRIAANDLVFNGASLLALLAAFAGCALLIRRAPRAVEAL
ncbi:hypothetical protein [Leucobacter sp. cx-169]|uniref:hypothetical protein n=1 Tax=Leucobacter sp. cx-169 TaxID=2770549 RepID=UPI00165DC772|nr:hypothetical protein [Leucobacter sp. cx-169]MBC9927330.1 hypothetical protein [Leucobacter sp. cx-169]